MIPADRLQALYQHTWYYNLKIPLFYAMWIGLGAIAWNSSSAWMDWPCYVAMGYMQMSIVTFMHDATHNILFKAKWTNWAFGIFAMIPFVISFVGFKDDHLEHHKYNRSPRDPDAFTMGTRAWYDFLQFYAYVVLGLALSALYFGLIYPIKAFTRKQWLIHAGEILLHAAVYVWVYRWAASRGIAGEVLAIWLIPLVFFGYFNSVRFIAEHYGAPWNGGQLVGTRTVISNQVHSFFWNNINYHIGHHVYPGVPWYNLQKLHAEMLPDIEHLNAIVDKSYFAVFARAVVRGPETIETADIRHDPRGRATV